MSKSGDFFLKWPLHEENRTSTLEYLWKNETFLDVTLACDDDQIDAHKVILSAASPVLHNILKRNPHSHPLLYLRGTTKKDVQALLNFIYSGEAQILKEDLGDFMALATSLEVKGLVGGQVSKDDGESWEPEFKEIKVEEGQNKMDDTDEELEIADNKEMLLVNGRPKDEENIFDPLEKSKNENELSTYSGNEVEENLLFSSDTSQPLLLNQNILNPTWTEYRDKLSEFITTNYETWECKKCPCTTTNKVHM